MRIKRELAHALSSVKELELLSSRCLLSKHERMHRGSPPVYSPYSINHRSLAGAMIFLHSDNGRNHRAISLGKPQINLVFHSTFRNFAANEENTVD